MWGGADPDLVVILTTGAVISIGIPLVRAFTRRLDRQQIASPSDLAAIHARLERIEQGIEAIAIEAERSAEADRFMAKLLSDREGVALPAVPRDR